MSCGVGQRCGPDLELLWLWHRPAATAPIRLQAWEPPYAMGAALKRQKKKKPTQEDALCPRPNIQLFFCNYLSAFPASVILAFSDLRMDVHRDFLYP